PLWHKSYYGSGAGYGQLPMGAFPAVRGRAVHGNQLTYQLDKIHAHVTEQLDKVYVTTGALDKVYVTTGALNEVYVTTGVQDEVYVTTTGVKDEVYVTTELKDEVCVTTHKQSDVFVTTDKQSEIYVTTDKQDEVCVTTDNQDEVYVTNDTQDEVYVTSDKQDDVYVTTDKRDEVYATTDEQDEVFVTMTEPGAEWQGFGLKPPTFDGHEEMGSEMSFVMRAYLGISMADAVHRLGVEGDAATKMMLFALVLTAKGSAQMLIRGAEDQNGALAWRALIKRYEAATAMRAQSIMTAILKVENFPSDLAGFEQCHSDMGARRQALRNGVRRVTKDWKPKVQERKVYSMMWNGMWLSFWTLADSCADEHVRGIRDSPRIILEFQAADVKQHIISVGKFCTKMESRAAWCDGKGGLLRHETAGLVKPKKTNDHYALECWTKMYVDMGVVHGEMALLAPIGAAVAAARPGEESEDGDAGPVAIPDDHETVDPRRQPVDYVDLFTREPLAEVIERHELTHYPAEPGCEICSQARTNDVARKKEDSRDELIPLLSFNYGQAGIEGDPVDFEFVLGSGAPTGGIWSTAIIPKVRDDVCPSSTSTTSSRGTHDCNCTQRGAAVFSFIMAVRARAIKDGICETFLMGQSERCNSQARGRADRVTQTVRHAAWLCNRCMVREGTNLTPFEKTHMLKHQKPTVAVGEAVICRRPGAQVNKLGLPRLEGIWPSGDARTGGHLIGAPTRACRPRAVKRKVEGRRWDKVLFDKMRSPKREREGGERSEGKKSMVATIQIINAAMLVSAGLHDHAVAFGDCSGAFHRAPLTEDRIFLEPPPEAGVPEGHVREALCAFPRSKGAPKAWEDHGADTMEELEMVRGHYDGCLFAKLSNSYAISGKTSLTDDVLKELGLETAKPSVLPETTNEMHMKSDEFKLDTVGHSCHRGMSGPTEKDLAGPQKMDRYLAGARDYKMQLLPNKGDIAVECWVGAEWADDKTDGISTRGGILKHHGCTILSWSRRQGCAALSLAESELHALGSGAAEALGLASLLEEWKEKPMLLAMSDSSSVLHIVKKRGPGQMKHAEMRFLALQQWREQGCTNEQRDLPDKHVRGIRDSLNVELKPGCSPNLTVADGALLRYYGSKTATLCIAGDRRIILEFQAADVKQHIMSVGKFCTKMENRAAWCDGKGGLLRHETAGLVKPKKTNDHYALECWTKMYVDMGVVHGEMALLAPIGAAVAAARPGEEGEDGDAGPVAVPDDRETVDPRRQPVDYVDLETREPLAEVIERHELTHYPAEPGREICSQARANDVARKKEDSRDELIPLLSFNYGQAGIEGDPVDFEFVLGSGAPTGGIWAIKETFLMGQSERCNSQARGRADRVTQAVRQAARLCNRCMVRGGANLTPFEKTHMLKHQKPTVGVGEAVICRRPGAQVNKLGLPWLEGIWPGGDARTGEHLIGTPTRARRPRAAKRKVESRRWDKELFDQMSRHLPGGRQQEDSVDHEGPRAARGLRGHDPSLPHLKAMLVSAGLHDHAVAFGDCSGAFHQAPLTEGRIFLEPPPEAGVPGGHVREALCAFPRSKGAPKAWEDHGADTMEELEMVRGHCDGCLFAKLSNRMMAGGGADDFLITGPSDEVDLLLEVMGERWKSADVVELTQNGDQAPFLNAQVEKVEGSYATSGETSLTDDVLKELGLETAKPSVLPKSDEFKLDTVGHSCHRTCVGKQFGLASRCPDIQRGIGVLSRGMSGPTEKDLRRPQKMDRYLAGARDYKMQLLPNKGDIAVECWVDAEWADDKTDGISTRGGILKHHGHMKHVGMRFLALQQWREQ
ncbi:unnamed protein product, partial [Prorocentrum cordatum]